MKAGDKLPPTSAPGKRGDYVNTTRPPKLWAPLKFEDRYDAASKFIEDNKKKLSEDSTVEDAGLSRIDERSKEADTVKLFTLFVLYPVERALGKIKLPKPG